MGDKKKSEKVAKQGEQKCLRPYVDRYNIQRRCQRKKGHWGKCSA